MAYNIKMHLLLLDRHFPCQIPAKIVVQTCDSDQFSSLEQVVKLSFWRVESSVSFSA